MKLGAPATAVTHVGVDGALDETRPAPPPSARGVSESSPFFTSFAPAFTTGSSSVLARIGRFIVFEALGEGGMGFVYTAYDELLDRKVAIKVLRPESFPEADAVREQMSREAQAMARVSHPNIVTVHEVGALGGQLFIAMEFIRGRTLAAWIAGGPHPWREAVDILGKAGRGLAAAHEAGLVHGDFKPANVMLGDDGAVKVLDFGLARVHDDPRAGASAPAQAGPTLGTPAYMAPEQLSGIPATPRSDQFSFCVSLYEALYNQDPFASEAAQRAGELAEPPSGVGVPAAVLRVLRRGLAVDPARRFADMPELLAALEGALHRRQRLGLVPVGLAALLGGAALALGSLGPTQDACAAAPRELHGLWDPPAIELVHARLVATGLPYAEDTWSRVQPRLDAYAQAIVERRVEACRAHADGSMTPQLFDLRTACLDQRRASLAAFVRILQAGDTDVVRSATAAAATLPPVAACDDTQALTDVVVPHSDPPLAARVARARELLAEAQAQELTGRFVRGLAIVEAIDPASVAHPPLLAELGLRRASLLSEMGQHQAAEAELAAALKLALTSRHHLAAAAIATRRDFIRAARLQRPGDVLEDGPMIEGLVARAELYSEGATYRGDHANNLGIADAVLGRHAAAQRHFSDALSRRREALGPDHPQVVYAMGNLGLSYLESADLGEAVELLRTALAAAESSLGPRHPHVALLAINLGYAHHTLMQYDEAKRQLSRALELQHEQLGAESPDLHYVLQTLGAVALDQRHCEEATGHYQRALRLLESGGQGPSSAVALAGLGRAATCSGDHAGALTYLQRAQAMAAENHGADELLVARVLGYTGDALLAAGRQGEALATYERAHQIFRARLAPGAPELAESYRLIAEAHHRRHDLAAATSFAELAREVHAASGPQETLAGASVRLLLGTLALERGEPEVAAQHFERAVTGYTIIGDPANPGLALARFGLARALSVPAGAPTPEARALAEQALTALQAVGRYYPDELREVRAWLAGRAP